MRALGPMEALRESLRLFWLRPFATLALGLALLTSLFAVSCYGLGIVAAPWFLCELFALQIALGSGRRPERTRAWLGAGLVQGLAVMFLCTTVALTLLSVGLTGGVLHSVFVWIVAGALTLTLTVHFEHAPALLLDRGGSLSAAMLESARIVAASGRARTWFTSGIAHGLQLAPVVLGVAATAAFGTLSSTLIWGLALLPVCAFCLAVGQGMVVSSYLSLRDQVVPPDSLPKSAALSPGRAALWSVLLAAVLVGPVAVSGALVRPALPKPEGLGPSAAALLEATTSPEAVTRFIPDTALSLRVSQHRASIEASDGGGAGAIPLPRGALEKVRVARVARSDAQPPTDEPRLLDAVFAIELTMRDGRVFTTWIDDAGVRLDDSFERRLGSLLPGWALFALVVCVAFTTVWVAIVLPPQGRARMELAASVREGRPNEEIERLGRAFARRALLAAALLTPSALGSLAIGLWAAFGEGTLPP